MRVLQRVRKIRWGPTHIVWVSLHSIIFLAGIVAAVIGGNILTPIGTSLIAAGAAGLLIFGYVYLSDRRTERVEMLTDFGLRKAYNERGPNIRDVYDERLNDVNKSIDIMGFGLKTFRQDQSHKFEDWAGQVNVRVLLIDPDFPNDEHTYAEQRDFEEGEGNIREDVLLFIEETEHLIIDDQSKFDVRLYQCLPSMTIFRIDDYLFWGPYSVKEQSRNMPTFLVGYNGELFGYLKTHFEEIWDDDELSRDVPEEWLE